MTIILTSFDGVRREVARIVLERLIEDRRIHPARIEEMVLKIRNEMDKYIQEIGEQEIIEVGLVSNPEEIGKLVGDVKYRTSYGQNVLNHSIEMAYI